MSDTNENLISTPLRLYIGLLALLFILGLSLGENAKYAWAQRELELYKQIKLSSWRAFVDTYVSEKYWELFERQDASERNTDQSASAYQRQHGFTNNIERLLSEHNVRVPSNILRAGAVFGWFGNDIKADGLLRDLTIKPSSRLVLFQPDFARLASALANSAISARFDAGELVALRCKPPTRDQVEFSASYRLSGVGNGKGDQIADYSTLDNPKYLPLVTSSCSMEIAYDKEEAVSDISVNVRGNLISLQQPDATEWLETNFLVGQPDVDFRLKRILSEYRKPFLDVSGTFLPFAHRIWPEISSMSVEDAVFYLNEKRAQRHDDVDILGFKVPYELVVKTNPILITILCFYIFDCSRRASNVSLADGTAVRDIFERKKILILLSVAVLIMFPISILTFTTYRNLLWQSETDTFRSLVAAYNDAVAQAAWPPYWHDEAQRAGELISALTSTVLLSLFCNVVILVVGWQTLKRLIGLNAFITKEKTFAPQ
ncbi:hypothetical protein ACU8V1_13940 [Rhizobium leguminosarum]